MHRNKTGSKYQSQNYTQWTAPPTECLRQKEIAFNVQAVQNKAGHDFWDQEGNQNRGYVGGQQGKVEGDWDFGQCRTGDGKMQTEDKNEV